MTPYTFNTDYSLTGYECHASQATNIFTINACFSQM